MKSDLFICFINGQKVQDKDVDPEWTLLRYLREKLGLRGSKMGCGEGGCGACTIVLSKLDRREGTIRHFSANACLLPICAVYGLSVITVEGIGSTRTRLHPVQERLAKAHGSQCGFCTPGFVMSMYALLRNCPRPTLSQIEEALVGNLCRCTGYRPIIEGFRTFSSETDIPIASCGRSDCCMLRKGLASPPNERSPENGHEENGLKLEQTAILFDPESFSPYDPSQEIIFPPELMLSPELETKSLTFLGPRVTFYRPSTLYELLRLKHSFPKAKIVVGNTEVGIEVKFKGQQYSTIIHPGDIPELLKFEVTESYLEIGSSLPFARIEIHLKKLLKELPDHKTSIIRAIVKILKLFAGPQIRNVAGFGGNIMTGSPISDLNPILMASHSTLVFKSQETEREIPLDDKFFVGYRKNAAKEDEVLMSIKIPFPSKGDYFEVYKQSRRQDDDIAIVNAAMFVSFGLPGHGFPKVNRITLAFGGMAPTTILATNTMQRLRGYMWGEDLVEKATRSLLQELKLEPDCPGGMADFRLALTASFFFKFYLSVSHHLHNQYPEIISPLQDDEALLIHPHPNLPVRSTQFFQNVPEGQEKIDPVGRPVPHLSSFKQTTGEAVYTDDIPHRRDELFAALVVSSRSHAMILGIDESSALAVEGVKGFLCARDVPEGKKFGSIFKDEEYFASSQVHHVGEIVGLIVATDPAIAHRAAKLVKISYEDLPNPIYTIQEAIKADTTTEPHILEDGNVEEGFRTSEFILDGEIYVGGQEHFYIETNVALAIPHEGGELELISSTQSPTDMQKEVASALGVPQNHVTCKTTRLGGGFGGKETRTIAIATPVCIAAVKLGRPVRIVLERDEDMLVTGGRNPALGRWKVGFNKDGHIIALQLRMFFNMGFSVDLSIAALDRAILSATSAYSIPNVRIWGQGCYTNLPSNTAFRGFGAPQATLIMEDIITRTAEYLDKDPKQVREVNLCGPDCRPPFGQLIEECNVEKCWEQVIASSNYERRHRRIQIFNRKNRYIKRGISAIPVRYGIGFQSKPLNQAGALVHVYVDGSVLISHGGVEMGQGLHTKMIQIASKVLQVPSETIHIAETSTDKVPNTSPSAASLTSDLNGMAIMDACKKILERLAQFKTKMVAGQWKDWVLAAYQEQVPLSATGFYRNPDIKIFLNTMTKGHFFNYFCFGAAVSEVEVDCLTGDHKVLRTDIVMDVGTSLNPAIDIGQIEGAFMQGYGLFTMEQLVFSSSGVLLTRGPGAYKIPSVADIPREFNVSLLRGSTNPRAIFSSKAVGEPPLLLSTSVFFAIREAVKEVRGDTAQGRFQFNSPATTERIRMACGDFITKQIECTEKGSFRSWSLDL